MQLCNNKCKTSLKYPSSSFQKISNLEPRNPLLVLRSTVIEGSSNSIISRNLSSISLLIGSFASEASPVKS